MVCGSLTAGFDTLCNCCGCFGTTCCGVGKEGCCNFCNHCFCFGKMFCEMCPCGHNGCIGFPNHLCGCCGNCNLMCYAGACTPCFVADLHIATQTEGEASGEWSNVVCNCVILMVLQQIFDMAGQSAKISILRNISQLVQLIYYIYMAIIFGYAAQRIASAKGFDYEAAQCCTMCYEQGCCSTCGRCCSSFDCCCAFSLCYNIHTLQVARVLETDTNMQNKILEGRPEQCKCCNCWKTRVPLELTTGTGSNGVGAV